MLTYTFDNRGTLSLYEFLYTRIREDILAGTLRFGEKMPSKRAFAHHLGVSVITVENAYEQLVAEGYLEARARQGFFVCSIAQTHAKTPEHTLNKQDSSIPHKMPKAHISTVFQSTDTPLVADLSNNALAGELFPYATWAKIMRSQLTYHQKELTQRSPSGGVLLLREQLAAHLKAYRGMNVQPEQIIVGAGSEYLHGLVVALLGRTKRFAVEEPGYRTVARIYQSQGVHCEHIPLDEQGLCMNELERRHIDVMHVSPTHHFPTGTTMSIGRRFELLSWAGGHEGRYLIEDDYDSEFRLKGRPIPALASIDNHDRVIYLNTFTKSLSPTVRIGYLVLPQSLVSLFNERLGFLSNTVSNFEQYTLAEFLRQGFFERHINRMRTTYATRRDVVLDSLKTGTLSQRATIIEENAGLHFLLHIAGDFRDEDLQEILHNKGLRLSPLSVYYHEKKNAPAHTYLINYSSLSEESIEPAFALLAQAVIEAEARG